jgi:hypothetical protein
MSDITQINNLEYNIEQRSVKTAKKEVVQTEKPSSEVKPTGQS